MHHTFLCEASTIIPSINEAVNPTLQSMPSLSLPRHISIPKPSHEPSLSPQPSNPSFFPLPLLDAYAALGQQLKSADNILRTPGNGKVVSRDFMLQSSLAHPINNPMVVQCMHALSKARRSFTQELSALPAFQRRQHMVVATKLGNIVTSLERTGFSEMTGRAVASLAEAMEQALGETGGSDLDALRWTSRLFHPSDSIVAFVEDLHSFVSMADNRTLDTYSQGLCHPDTHHPQPLFPLVSSQIEQDILHPAHSSQASSPTSSSSTAVDVPTTAKLLGLLPTMCDTPLHQRLVSPTVLSFFATSSPASFMAFAPAAALVTLSATGQHLLDRVQNLGSELGVNVASSNTADSVSHQQNAKVETEHTVAAQGSRWRRPAFLQPSSASPVVVASVSKPTHSTPSCSLNDTCSNIGAPCGQDGCRICSIGLGLGENNPDAVKELKTFLHLILEQAQPSDDSTVAETITMIASAVQAAHPQPYVKVSNISNNILPKG